MLKYEKSCAQLLGELSENARIAREIESFMCVLRKSLIFNLIPLNDALEFKIYATSLKYKLNIRKSLHLSNGDFHLYA